MISFDDLTSKYKDLFTDQRALQCDDGWFDLIDVLCERILRETKISQDDSVKILQVKEKFGGLRFYISGGNDRVRGMIDLAESLSYKICERCGNPGQLRKIGWLKTYCDEHAKEKMKI